MQFKRHSEYFIYLNEYNDGESVFDLYISKDKKNPVLVARWGDGESDFSFGFDDIEKDDELKEAARRAISFGHLDAKTPVEYGTIGQVVGFSEIPYKVRGDWFIDVDHRRWKLEIVETSGYRNFMPIWVEE